MNPYISYIAVRSGFEEYKVTHSFAGWGTVEITTKDLEFRTSPVCNPWQLNRLLFQFLEITCDEWYHSRWRSL